MRSVWKATTSFVACLLLVNVGLLFMDPIEPRFADPPRSAPLEPQNLNSVESLSKKMDPIGRQFMEPIERKYSDLGEPQHMDAVEPVLEDSEPTERLPIEPEHLEPQLRSYRVQREGLHHHIGSIEVEVVTDPRTVASSCIKLDNERQHCVEEARESFERLTRLYSAPLHPLIPFSMEHVGTPRGMVLSHHHSISCWPAPDDLDDSEDLRAILEAGGRCVMLLDFLDVHEYPDYSDRVFAWFLEEGARLDMESINVPESGGDTQGHLSGVLRLVSHEHSSTARDGRWGEFNDILRMEELAELETGCWDCLLERDLAVDPEDVFILFMMYAENSASLWRHKVEAMVLSLQKNGGKLKKSHGALLVYTPHGEDPPDLRELEPLLLANGFEIVYMPTPRLSDGRTLHFLKTDLISYRIAWEHRFIIFMDLDMLILGDVVPFISPRHLRMVPATHFRDVNASLWQRHGFSGQPERVMNHFGTMRAAYYNSGLMIAPSRVLAEFLLQAEREARLELDAGTHDFLTRDQVMFQLAFYTLRPPFLQLPHDLNLDSAIAPDEGCKVLSTPIIYHYHRNPLALGTPPVPPSRCSAYDLLKTSFLALQEYYISNRVL